MQTENFDEIMNKMNLDFEIYSQFSSIRQELEYIKNALEFLNQSVNNRLQDMEANFKDDINSIYLEDFDSEFYDNYPNKNLPNEMILEDLSFKHEELWIEHDSISGHIIQSILVRQVSVMEKFLKGLYNYSKNKKPSIVDSLTIFEKIKKDGIKKIFCEILCTKNENEKTFSDIKKIADALKKVTGINIKELDQSSWNQLRIMNELRNRFAHGSNEFIINKGIFDDLKKEFGNDFIIEIRNNEGKYLCKIEKDFSPLIEFNKNMQNYIKQLNSKFRIYFNIDTSSLPSI